MMDKKEMSEFMKWVWVGDIFFISSLVGIGFLALSPNHLLNLFLSYGLSGLVGAVLYILVFGERK